MNKLDPRTRRALITGVTGQDGRYLSRLLLRRGYHVFGLVRRLEGRRALLKERLEGVHLIAGDVTSQSSIAAALRSADPHEVYNLASLSSVGESFRSPQLAFEANALSVALLLDTLRTEGMTRVRVFQASSSEMFGEAVTTAHDEDSALRPVSPYGVSKASAHQLCSVYRSSFGMFVSCGILFNHESPYRPDGFVTRKVAAGVARISLGLQDTLTLGNLDVRRDWGYAGDYVDAMHRIVGNDTPEDFVVATGVDHSLREFVGTAFQAVDISNWEERVHTDSTFMRRSDLRRTVGNPQKARRVLGWKAEIGFQQLVERLVAFEVERARSQARGL